MKKTKISILLILILSMVIFSSKCVQAFSNSVELDKKAIIFGKVEADEKDNGVGSMQIDETIAGSNYKLYYQVVIFPDDDYKKWIGGGLTAEESQSLVPDFVEGKWIETTDKSFYIDRTKLGMADHSTVWAKLVKADNTEVYNYQTYAIGGVLEEDDTKQTPTSSDDAQNGNNIPSTNTSTAQITITDGNGGDFSKGNLTTSACVKIDGINFDSSKAYYVAVTRTKTEPTYDKSNFAELNKTTKLAKISGTLEENGDLYVWLYEEDTSLTGNHEHSTLIAGQKVERPQYPSYGNRIIYAGLSKAFSTNIPRLQTDLMTYRARKITVKIGKVTDGKILNKIKNKDASGMADLLSYAKSATAELTTTVNSTSNLTTGNSVDLSKLNAEKGAYYYVYFVMDDENGTYYPIEDINLLYSIGNNILCNQNEDGFKWDIAEDDAGDVVENKKDDTVAPSNLAKTGEKAGIIILIAVVGISALIYNIKSRKLY